MPRETLTMPNSEAWTAMGVRLAIAGVRRVCQVRDEAWAIRRELHATKGLNAGGNVARIPTPTNQSK